MKLSSRNALITNESKDRQRRRQLSRLTLIAAITAATYGVTANAALETITMPKNKCVTATGLYEQPKIKLRPIKQPVELCTFNISPSVLFPNKTQVSLKKISGKCAYTGGEMKSPIVTVKVSSSDPQYKTNSPEITQKSTVTVFKLTPIHGQEKFKNDEMYTLELKCTNTTTKPLATLTFDVL